MVVLENLMVLKRGFRMFQGAYINLQPKRTMTITIIRTITKKKKKQEGRGEKRERDRVEKKIDGIK
jgi:hypothetical protein